VDEAHDFDGVLLGCRSPFILESSEDCEELDFGVACNWGELLESAVEVRDDYLRNQLVDAIHSFREVHCEFFLPAIEVLLLFLAVLVEVGLFTSAHFLFLRSFLVVHRWWQVDDWWRWSLSSCDFDGIENVRYILVL
jgi:hypothetical protein